MYARVGPTESQEHPITKPDGKLMISNSLHPKPHIQFPQQGPASWGSLRLVEKPQGTVMDLTPGAEMVFFGQEGSCWFFRILGFGVWGFGLGLLGCAA